MVLLLGRFCTACIINLCLTLSTVLDYCTIHMLMAHNTITIKKQDHFADKLSDIEQCVSEIKLWMNHNMLKLNDDKTEFIVFKSEHNVNMLAE